MRTPPDSRGPRLEREPDRRRRLPADAALNLAIFRIPVGLLLLATREVRGAAAWVTLAPVS